MEEIIRSLLENGSISRTEHRYVLTRGTSAIHVPDSIQGIIAARMDRMGYEVKRILQVGSVIGMESGCGVLENVTGMKEEIKPSLQHLRELEFIHEKQTSPNPAYIFKHALTQEVAYSGLLTSVRREIHEKVARAIEGLFPERLEEYYELLDFHYVRSDDRVKAVEYMDLANQKAATSR